MIMSLMITILNKHVFTFCPKNLTRGGLTHTQDYDFHTFQTYYLLIEVKTMNVIQCTELVRSKRMLLSGRNGPIKSTGA